MKNDGVILGEKVGFATKIKSGDDKHATFTHCMIYWEAHRDLALPPKCHGNETEGLTTRND